MNNSNDDDGPTLGQILACGWRQKRLEERMATLPGDYPLAELWKDMEYAETIQPLGAPTFRPSTT